MTLIIYFLFKYHTFTLPRALPWYGNNMQSENTFEFPIEYQIPSSFTTASCCESLYLCRYKYLNVETINNFVSQLGMSRVGSDEALY